MKTKLTGDNKNQLAGLRGGMVDQRLKVELLPDAEAGGQAARARYRQDLLQFEITRSGTGGIKRFVLDDSLGSVDSGTDARATTLKLAKEDHWVWDFNDTAPSHDKSGGPPGGQSQRDAARASRREHADFGRARIRFGFRNSVKTESAVLPGANAGINGGAVLSDGKLMLTGAFTSFPR